MVYIGAAGTAVLGALLFGESRDLVRLLDLLLVEAGVVGLKVSVGR
jgi:quaternary ammonium compound-resistance protein SugE